MAYLLTRSLVRPAPAAAAAACARRLDRVRSISSFYNAAAAGLTSDQAELREAVSAFACSELEPRAQEIDRTNTGPLDLWPRMGELGLLGITVPEEQGGTGRGYFDHLLAMEGLHLSALCLRWNYLQWC